MFLSNLAGSKQQSASDRWSVIAIKHRIILLPWLKMLLQPPSITSLIEVVIISGKTENSHSCTHLGKI